MNMRSIIFRALWHHDIFKSPAILHEHTHVQFQHICWDKFLTDVCERSVKDVSVWSYLFIWQCVLMSTALKIFCIIIKVDLVACPWPSKQLEMFRKTKKRKQLETFLELVIFCGFNNPQSSSVLKHTLASILTGYFSYYLICLNRSKTHAFTNCSGHFTDKLQQC